ncbi:glutathione S-transferase 1-like [Battus philenor]|uniref:glutathione S-transferase 1-like n=1 Tax=Battus philenor TaxID=42288 RepID=UPI0035CFBFA1
MVLTLYKLDPSPPARAVLMTIHVAKIPDVQYVDVNILEGEQFSKEFLQMNPQHTIPTLKDDDFIVWDSHAISVYLLTKYSDDVTFYPIEPKKRALIDQRLHFDSGVLFATLRSTVRPLLFLGERTYRKDALKRIKNAYDLTEKFLTNNWMVGDEITLADICCVASISSLNEILPIDSDMYPNMIQWLERCKEQEFYKKCNQPGLEEFRAILQSKLE